MSYSDSFVCGKRFTNNCAHFLSNWMIKNEIYLLIPQELIAAILEDLSERKKWGKSLLMNWVNLDLLILLVEVVIFIVKIIVIIKVMFIMGQKVIVKLELEVELILVWIITNIILKIIKRYLFLKRLILKKIKSIKITMLTIFKYFSFWK